MVRSSSVRYGVSWLGLERSCPVRFSRVWRCLIDVLRGLVLSGTVLSCPVRLCKAWLFEALSGMEERGPVLLGQVRFGSAVFGNVRRFMVRSSAVAWGTVGRCFVWLGKVSSWQGGVVQSEVRYTEALSWFGEVLFCAVGIGGLLYGMALHAGALLRSGMVMYCTVESGLALLRAAGQALLRHYLVLRSWVMRSPVGQALVYIDAAGRGFVRFCRVWFCWVLLRSGVGKQGSVMRGAVSCSTVW